jgi:hypothetical protein
MPPRARHRGTGGCPLPPAPGTLPKFVAKRSAPGCHQARTSPPSGPRDPPRPRRQARASSPPPSPRRGGSRGGNWPFSRHRLRLGQEGRVKSLPPAVTRPPYRLLRSPAFWSGVPGLVFLLWGWGLSIRHISSAGIGLARPWGIGQAAGEVVAVWNSEGSPEWRKFGARHEGVSAEYARAWKMRLAEQGEWTSGLRYIVIPYSAVVLAYTLVWIGLVVWRWRKHRALRPEDT